MTPIYDRDGITLYCGDCREVLPTLKADVMLTDPPYGIAYCSGMEGALPRSIANDKDTSVRDAALDAWGDRPALVFGTWRAPRPAAARMVLVWDKGGALGMGDLSIPWKPGHEEIYVIGRGFAGRRSSDVLAYPPVQSMAKNGRVHPNEKPVALLEALLAKCPPGVVLDPFAGSGSTLVAADRMGRKAIGIELDPKYCDVAIRRLERERAQGCLFPRGVA
jgi:DNA modification methylase